MPLLSCGLGLVLAGTAEVVGYSVGGARGLVLALAPALGAGRQRLGGPDRRRRGALVHIEQRRGGRPARAGLRLHLALGRARRAALGFELLESTTLGQGLLFALPALVLIAAVPAVGAATAGTWYGTQALSVAEERAPAVEPAPRRRRRPRPRPTGLLRSGLQPASSAMVF